MKKIMKKIILSLVFAMFTVVNVNAQVSKIYSYTPKDNYLVGEENGEIFGYTLIYLVDSLKNPWMIHLYHFLPSEYDDNDSKGKTLEFGRIKSSGKILFKLQNDSILEQRFVNRKNQRYDVCSCGQHKYYLMTLTINDDIMQTLINNITKKIRIETNTAYIDLHSNIFNSKYFKFGYDDIKKQIYNVNNKKDIYDDF